MGNMRVAVVGAGVAGLTAAYTLAQAGANVVLYEKESRVGGHARTVMVDGVAVDVGSVVWNRVVDTNVLQVLQNVGMETELSDMSFSVSVGGGRGCEWGTKGLAGIFAQKRNAINPFFLQMIKEIVRFEGDVWSYLERLENHETSFVKKETLGGFLSLHGYSKKFRDCYLLPVCASIWCCSSKAVLNFSAAWVLTVLRKHRILQIFGRPQVLTVKEKSEAYLEKITSAIKELGSDIQTSCGVVHVSSTGEGVQVVDAKGRSEIFDRCIIALRVPQVLATLGQSATFDERSILGAFQYTPSYAYLHQDGKLMPSNHAAWCALNFCGDRDDQVCVTYSLNTLQNLGDTGHQIFLTVNPVNPPEHVVAKWEISHLIPSPAATIASERLPEIQGKRNIWYCGDHQGYGFAGDGVKAGLAAANSLLGQKLEPVNNTKRMVLSWFEYAGRLAVIAFLRTFIQTGHLRLVEDDETVVDIVGPQKSCDLQCTLRVRPAFYWKVATKGDLGLADAFIDGDVLVDSRNGLFTLFLILIANRDISKFSGSQQNTNRGWWTPVMLTSVPGSAVSYLRHTFRKNSLTNARRNISQHYDLSNDLFALFLDDTMTYSCAIFKRPDEPLLDAQRRKLKDLVKKARITSTHHVLEIGFGWGSFALTVVQQTGCSYTGITLSIEQLNYAQRLVSKAHLEDKISLKLCDYRSLAGYKQYDRIVACEMVEAVGFEYYQEFFSRCDHLLAVDGLLIVQTATIPEQRFHEYCRSSDFIKEYIFPGGSLPTLSILSAAMAAGSSLCVERVENIGMHYKPTLHCWRDAFLRNHSEIKRLGFNEKFIRTWHYYFDYCAAGFATCTLGNLQIVFSRPGNVQAFGDPYKEFSDAF